MFWTAAPPGSLPRPICDACSDGNTSPNNNCTMGAGGADPTFMAWADSPNGPWSVPQQLFKDQSKQLDADTNLAVHILPNSSVIGMARTAGPPTGIMIHLVTAAHWKDPNSYSGQWQTRLFPGNSLDFAGLEDPFIYMGEGGVFHAVFHNQIEEDDQRLCGGHGVCW